MKEYGQATATAAHAMASAMHVTIRRTAPIRTRAIAFSVAETSGQLLPLNHYTAIGSRGQPVFCLLSAQFITESRLCSKMLEQPECFRFRLKASRALIRNRADRSASLNPPELRSTFRGAYDAGQE